MFLHNQKRERKVPTLGNFNVGTKAHIGRASLSQLPIVVTQTPRQDGTPKLGGVNPPPNTWLLGWRLGEQAEARGWYRAQWVPGARFPLWVGFKGPLKGQSHVKRVLPTTNANYEARVLRHNLGIFQSGICIRMHCLKTNQYCQGLACKFLPKLAKNYRRARSILLLS